ncbi:MAG: NAD(P)/FAD-dependent oxidoreductase [Solirubrobacterales bacterium]|nr:NAD(P)/FAD-dependent oxidoreductase [Solirubrobacterales bacterium]
MSSSNERHRVVIVGSGFGGLAAAKALRRAPVDVTVIDRTNHHLFQPLLYQMATGIVAAGDIAPPIRDILRHHANTRVLLGDVVDVDLDAREVMLERVGGSARVGYDSLIVAAGAGQSYFGHDEFSVHAPGLKSIDDALEVRGRIFGAFELAELERDERQREAWLTIAVVGAGPTGVEVAGQIAELSHRALKRNFRTFDPAQTRVILLDAVETVLPTFPESLRRRAHHDLRRLGVDTQLGTTVTGVDEYGLDVVRLDGSAGRIEARTKVWAAGVKASALGARLAELAGGAMDRSGRVAVRLDCTLPGHPEVFVIGDLMSLNNLPGVAKVAMQSGRHAARTIARRLRGEDTMREFRYHDLGTMATVSRFRAVAWLGPIRVGGVMGWLLWLGVHLAFLTGFKNRVATLARWIIAFLGRGRPERTITEQQVFARTRKPLSGVEVSS